MLELYVGLNAAAAAEALSCLAGTIADSAALDHHEADLQMWVQQLTADDMSGYQQRFTAQQLPPTGSASQPDPSLHNTSPNVSDPSFTQPFLRFSSQGYPMLRCNMCTEGGFVNGTMGTNAGYDWPAAHLTAEEPVASA